MVPRPAWSTRRAASVVGAGVATAVVGAVITFLGSLCQLGDSCGTSDHATAVLGILMIAAGLVVPPLAAAWTTRRWWWLAAPVVVVTGVVVAVSVSDARNAARQRQAVDSYDAALNVSRTIDSAARFASPEVPPPTATPADRTRLFHQAEQAELAALEAARSSLARYGITLGAQHGPVEVDVSQNGRTYCYRLPLFALGGTALPGGCP